MPVEFEEFKDQIFNRPKTGVPMPKEAKIKPISLKNYNPLVTLLIKLRIAKNEDYAQLILLIATIIIFGIAIFYGVKAYQSTNPNINTTPIELGE